MNESIGMLSEAYFASRSVLLEWLNSLLGLNYTKIEQTASGIAVCQVFDALFPDAVRLEKVNFNARREYEYIQNYKVLQTAFTRVGIEKQVDVQKLIKGKYQDNLEFMQWVKGFFDQHASESALQYDGAARRAQLGKSLAQARPGTASAARHTAPSKGPVVARRQPAPVRPHGDSLAKENRIGNHPSANMVKRSEYEALEQQLEETKQALEESNQIAADCEVERDFYFSKLRSIEVVIQEIESRNPEDPLDSTLQQIMEILYMAEDDAAGDGLNPDEQVAALTDEKLNIDNMRIDLTNSGTSHDGDLRAMSNSDARDPSDPSELLQA